MTETMETRSIRRAQEVAASTPYLVLDGAEIVEALQAFQKWFGSDSVYYALKANADPALVACLAGHGGNFEVSSMSELEEVLKLDVPPSRMISAAPVKPRDFIEVAFQAGVTYFVADSPAEVEKISVCAPGSRLVARLIVSNEGSEWPLSGKFGVPAREAVGLLEQGRQSGLIPWGLAFHVGSQCGRPQTWIDALESARFAWDLAREEGIRLNSLNLGGGFPIEYTRPVLGTDAIAGSIVDAIPGIVPGVEEVLVEPGRAMVGHAGIMVSSVIGKGTRQGQDWLYLDVGVFNGLMESLGGIRYPIVAPREGVLRSCILAGPSCDSMDVIDRDVTLPDVEIGDRLSILSTGAYTTAYASEFGGCTIPAIHLI